MAAGTTYSGTVVVATQAPGAAYLACFAGVFTATSGYNPKDGSMVALDYRHKSQIEDIGGNVCCYLFGGKFKKVQLTMEIQTASLANAQVLAPGSLISLSPVKDDGTLDTAVIFLITEPVEIKGTRGEATEIVVTAVKDDSLTHALA